MSNLPGCPEPALLRVAFDSMGEGMFLVGLDGTVLYFNARAEELTGIRAADVVGRPCSEALLGGLRGVEGVVGRADHQAFEFAQPDGGQVAVHGVMRPLRDSEGASLGTVVTFHLPTATCHVPDEQRAANLDRSPQMVGRSPAVRKIVDTIRRVAASDATVLVTGESGTGKELVARSIHEASRRRNHSLVTVNCAALPQDLLESELFGHVRGAFTGAVRDRRGSVELAAGGTLFLDEIGDMPLPMQAKLLRLLQERTYQRVGDSRAIQADARILAATNVDLEQAISRGTFRQDLYFRLCVIPIRIPPLRERREDIAPLASFLLARRSVAAGRLPMRFSPEAMRLLEQARWEGNVRQLINVVDYVVALCESALVDARCLPDDFLTARPEAAGDRRARYQAGTRGESEASLIRATLEAHGYHRQRTADALGMDRATLYRKMREYRIVLPGSAGDGE